MQFDKIYCSGSGSGHVPLNFEDMSWYDGTAFNFRTVIFPSIKPGATNEQEKRKRLDLTWYHWVIFKGSVLFDFKSYSHTYISEEEILPTIEQLKPLISGSFKHLQTDFDARRGEYRILPAIEDISPDTIEQTAFQLMGVFLPEPK